MEDKKKASLINMAFYWVIGDLILLILMIITDLSPILGILSFFAFIPLVCWWLISYFIDKYTLEFNNAETPEEQEAITRKRVRVLSIILVIGIVLEILLGLMIYFSSSDDTIPTTNYDLSEEINGYWKLGDNIYLSINPTTNAFEQIVNDYYAMGYIEIEDDDIEFHILEPFNLIGGAFDLDDIYFEDANTFSCKVITYSGDEEQDSIPREVVYERISETDFNSVKERIKDSSQEEENNTPTTQESTENKTSYKTGMYKVGTDIPAGEYQLISSGSSSYVSVLADTTGNLGSIIDNDNFGDRGYVRVYDGEYLEIGRGVTAYPMAEATPFTGTTYKDGTFLVGYDIPAGEYYIQSNGGGYFCVSSGPLGSDFDIQNNDYFEGSTYATVYDGEYLKLSSNARIEN